MQIGFMSKSTIRRRFIDWLNERVLGEKQREKDDELIRRRRNNWRMEGAEKKIKAKCLEARGMLRALEIV